jgi:DNA-directed RNA polymerase subunit M/transcription elongation factor TFIIS
MSNKCPKCNQESLSFQDQNGDILDEPYCFKCSDFIYEYEDKDNINPTYYRKGIETTDYIVSHSMNYLEGNIIKYVTRYKDKGGLEDLKKAEWYLTRLIKQQENNNES